MGNIFNKLWSINLFPITIALRKIGGAKAPSAEGRKIAEPHKKNKKTHSCVAVCVASTYANQILLIFFLFFFFLSRT